MNCETSAGNSRCSAIMLSVRNTGILALSGTISDSTKSRPCCKQWTISVKMAGMIFRVCCQKYPGVWENLKGSLRRRNERYRYPANDKAAWRIRPESLRGHRRGPDWRLRSCVSSRNAITLTGLVADFLLWLSAISSGLWSPWPWAWPSTPGSGDWYAV